MNLKQELTTEQETNRIAKGYDIFSHNLIEQISKREYIIKGKYIVEDLTTEMDIEPIYQCSCPDHVYRGGVRCAHIIGVTFYILNGA